MSWFTHSRLMILCQILAWCFLPVSRAQCADEVGDFDVIAVLQHHYALSRPHDIEIQEGLAFVAGKGGSLAIVDVKSPQQPRLVSWRNDSTLHDAQTVLPFGQRLYVAGHAFHAVDITDPARPNFMLTIADPGRIGRINGMVRRGHLIVSANKTGFVSAFDISEQQQPKYIGSLHTRASGKVASPHDISLTRCGNYIVVVDQARPSTAQLRTYRIADADAHRPVDAWEPCGGVSREDLTGANRVVVSGNYAYIACSKSNPDNFKLAVIDLSVPENPRHVQTLSFAGSHPTGLTVAGCLLIAAGGRTIQAFDISDPRQPQSAAVFHSTKLFPSGEDNAHDLVYRDGYLFVTAQNDDQIGIVRIVDHELAAKAKVPPREI